MKPSRQIGIRGLKNQASRIVDEVRERGDEYVVTKHGKPVAVIRPWREEDDHEARRARARQALATLEAIATRVSAVAGRRSAAAAVSRARR
jgi:prevent-host-death family protein